jgi:hypothetical protein
VALLADSCSVSAVPVFWATATGSLTLVLSHLRMVDEGVVHAVLEVVHRMAALAHDLDDECATRMKC